MRMLIHLLMLLLLVQPALGQSKVSHKPVTFLVVESSGMPVEDACIEASLQGPGNASGKTAADGKLELILAKESILHVYVSKTGYYSTGGELWTGGMYRNAQGKLVPREVPDSFTITLKKVLNPVELIHVQYRGKLPDTGKPVGFDMEKGDWVRPNGVGDVSDVLFYLEHVDPRHRLQESRLSVLFPNPKDGIQIFMAARPFSMAFGSNLAPPHTAPLDGYQSVLSLESTVEKRTVPNIKGTNYLFRTRTRTDAAGEIRQACYGWIQGDIVFDPRIPDMAQIAFTYYFNPDPDPDARSLEYIRHVPQNR